MSADQLNRPTALDTTTRAVLDILSGTDIHTVAARTGMEPTDLTAAVAVYRNAGREALAAQSQPAWRHLYLQFADWGAAEQTAARHLLPALDAVQNSGQISHWWFIRKKPCWRLRLLTSVADPVPDRVSHVLDRLVVGGELHRWWPGIYEPEAAAFGGDTGMAIAHDLFHADSRAVLHQALTSGAQLGRREVSILLCATLMRAAGLEWYEQADVWHRVTQQRPLPGNATPDKIRAMSGDLLKLLVADTSSTSPMLHPGEDLASAKDWIASFRQAGRELGTAARDGTLDRGLREVIAYHIIFHWNRLALPVGTQSILAHAAYAAILTPQTCAAEGPVR
ncbi:thiopeptide-type bacteriocin biosynthesis protein [Streptomyces sp. F63]|uniref:thiopeptide-type bacteriocin biosynthesis protein n=1 Tax=Streptomyces sp. F63 TaxID=2824887 RepID=UPI001B36DBFD|nr:thiopeptide-type bacteriocin biosynthesis protein [Streptomyces sp. F63]MBQ0983729.1 thiopeptide-type bacteriocin biosynthesis protein [Streptomyces sp. F63]